MNAAPERRSAAPELPPGPWRSEEMGRLIGRDDPAWIRVLDADSRKVCDVTIDASVGSQGIGAARAIARWIVSHGPTPKAGA